MKYPIKVIVPAYIYPGALPRPEWSLWAAYGGDPIKYLIANPGSPGGPGTGLDTNYKDAIPAIQDSGIKVLGYVDTSYGAVTYATATGQIHDWYSLYGIRDIFFDQTQSGAAGLAYHQALTDYVRSFKPDATIMMNPGTTCDEGYAGMCDILCTFEGTDLNYANYVPQDWTLAYPREKFCHLVHTVPSESAMLAVLDQAQDKHVGYTYVVGSGIWTAIPSFFVPEMVELMSLSIGSWALELYNRMGPLTDQDEALGFPLLNYISAIGDMYFQQISDLARDRGEQPGWSVIMDPDQTPSDGLAWLAQMVGVRINPSLSNEANIGLMREPTGWKRGSPGAIKAAIIPYLTGTKSLILTERYTGDAYKVLVTTLTGEVPNPTAMQAAAIAQKPAGILMYFSGATGQTYLQLRTAKASYTIAKAAYVDYTAMRNG